MMTWLLFLIFPLLIGLWAQAKVKGAFNKYSQVPASSGITGAEAAERILHMAGIQDVEVIETKDFLGDHYDPAHKRLVLSPAVYGSHSVAALGIAAHEVGHAIQHAKAYGPLQLRMSVVPATMFASSILPFVILGGMFIPALGLMAVKVAVICYVILAAFQLITLPVEFDASKRAKIILQQTGMISGGEAVGVNKVLDSAALTYVAAFVATLSTLLYYLLILSGRRN